MCTADQIRAPKLHQSCLQHIYSFSISYIDSKNNLTFYHRDWTFNKQLCTVLFLSHCSTPPLHMLFLLSTAASGLTSHLCRSSACHYNAAPTCQCCAGSCFSYLPMMPVMIYRGSCCHFPGSCYFCPPSPPPLFLLLIHPAICCCCPTDASDATFRCC